MHRIVFPGAQRESPAVITRLKYILSHDDWMELEKNIQVGPVWKQNQPLTSFSKAYKSFSVDGVCISVTEYTIDII